MHLRSVLYALAIIALMVTNAHALEQLGRNAVQKNFIDNIWWGNGGQFLFTSSTGTYTFKKRNKVYGPWNYTLRSDGVIVHRGHTNYIFYETTNGAFQFKHTKSGKIKTAKP